ncbi:MAG TPA: hypothetical protein P5328_02980 [Candidatus Paceibacterota bacterium]|nr:hypothetical protein [Candidatus Paceibacterota bacterium]HRZ34402.1 hypothetical protein [Candidatus Paceibacterota bacterium]
MGGRNEDHAINHCGQRDSIKAELSREDFQEEVMLRAGRIVEGLQSGKTSSPHKLKGVEMVAQVIALDTIRAGAKILCEDMNVDFDQLSKLAASEHISSC